MHIVELKDLSLPGLAPYVRLTEAQLRSGAGSGLTLFLAESRNVIEAALQAGCEPVSFLAERKHLPLIEAMAAHCPDDLPVYTGDEALLAGLTGYRMHRGMLCAMKRPPLRSAEEICRSTKRIAVLEDLVDPSNVGAVFRSAAALGMDAVLLSPGCCDPLYRKAIRVSMGCIFRIPWAWLGERAEDWPGPRLAMLKEHGFMTAALALRADAIGPDAPVLLQAEKLALLLGNEGNGLRDDTIAACDRAVCIPMAHQVDSLNVAAAAAVAFWQFGHR